MIPPTEAAYEQSKNEVQAFSRVGSEVDSFARTAAAVRVSNPEEARHALTCAQQVKFLAKSVEEVRKQLVGPLNDQVKRINDFAKRVSQPLTSAEIHLKRELISWEEKLEAARKAEQERIELAARRERERLAAEAAAKAAEAEEDFFSDPVPVPMADSLLAAQSADIASRELAAIKANEENRVKGTSKTWAFEITDPAQVRREFCVPDEKLIREFVKNGGREMPGVRIFEKTTISVIGRR